MFAALLTVILATMCPFVSATLPAEQGLPLLTPQHQQCSHGLTTIIHLPETTAWMSSTVTALSIATTPHDSAHDDLKCPAQCLWIPTVPLTIDAGIPCRSSVVEKDDASRPFEKHLSNTDNSKTHVYHANVGPPPGSLEYDVGLPHTVDGAAPGGNNISSSSSTWPSCPHDLLEDHSIINKVGENNDLQSSKLPLLRYLPNPSRLTSIKNQLTILRFIVCWIGVGALCYTVGPWLPFSFAAQSVKRCSTVVEASCDRVAAGPSWLQRLEVFDGKEWRGKQKAAALFRIHNLCVSALHVVVASIRWLCNLCREVWQDKQKAIPAEIFLIKTPVFDTFAMAFAMAFFRLHRMHVRKPSTPVTYLRICNDFLQRHRSQNLEIRHFFMQYETHKVNLCNPYPSLALRGSTQQDKGHWAIERLPMKKSSATTKKPLIHLLDSEHFVFALEQALRVPKYRKLAVRLTKTYMENNYDKIKQLSVQIKAQEQTFAIEKDQINMYWQEKLIFEEHKADTATQDLEHYRINSEKKFAEMTTDHKLTFNQERDKARKAEDKAARVEEEKTKMSLELRRRDFQLSNSQQSRKELVASHTFDSEITEIKLKTHLGKIRELEAEARTKDQANTAHLERIRELEAEFRIKDEAASLLRDRLDRSQKSVAKKDTQIAKLTAQVEESEQVRNELKEAKKEIARLSEVIDAQAPQVKNTEKSKAKGTTSAESPFRRSEDYSAASDAHASSTEEPKAGLPTPQPISLLEHGFDVSQFAVNKSSESWDNDFDNSAPASTVPMSDVLNSLTKSRTIGEMIELFFPSGDSEPHISIDLQDGKFSSGSSIPHQTRPDMGLDLSETVSSISEPMAEATQKGSPVQDSTKKSCTPGHLDEVIEQIAEDLVELAVPDSFSPWCQSTFDVVELEALTEAIPAVKLPNAGGCAGPFQGHANVDAQIEPAVVVTSKDIFNIDTAKLFVRLPSNTINITNQEEGLLRQEDTISLPQAISRPSHKKYHYGNRGGRPVGSSGLHSSLAISPDSFGP